MSSPRGSRPGPLQFRYRFGSVEFDEARLDLRVGGLRVEIEQRPLQVLLALLRRAGEVVTKDELLDDVWSGRPTVENVLPNAVAKLRRALGVADADRVQTVPRVGYRIDGPLDRVAVGRLLDSRLALKPGMPVPARPQFILTRQLGPAHDSEVWLAQNARTAVTRVYKFGTDGERLSVLKREATLYRVLTESLGDRTDIARILDWNFETAPFFLECAYGGPNLLDGAEGGPLEASDLETRLRLFAQVVGAVVAAHSVGVLHKDLKPANVLIANPEAASAAWQLSLTDFGAGRLLDPERLQALGITQMGLTQTQPFDTESGGTLLYMPPEVLRGQAPTAQSDVYALGVMLYQFAVGDLRRPLTSGWERDVEDALLREDIAEATDGTLSRRLKSAAELLERLVRRDERRAARRASDLATSRALQIERSLERTRARRPWVIAAMGSLAVGLGVCFWFYRATVESERRLDRQYQVAQALNTFMTRDLIGAANPAVSGHADVRVIEAAKAAIPRIDTAFASQAPDIQAALHSALQESLSGLTEAAASVEEGNKAIAAYERVDPPDRLGAARARLRMVRDLDRLGRNAEVPELLQRVEADLPQLMRQDPLVQVEYLEARSQFKSEDLHQEAALQDDQAAWRLLQTLSHVPSELLNRVELNLANSLTLAGRFPEGERFLRELVVRESQTLGPRHQQTLYSTVVLANNLFQQNRPREAEELLLPAVDGLEAALGPTHGRTLLAKRVIGQIYFMRGQYDESLRTNTEVYEVLIKKFGDQYIGSIMALEWLGLGEQYRGNAVKGEELLRTSLKRAKVSLPDTNALVQHIRYALADCLIDLKKTAEAEQLLEGLAIDRLYEADVTTDWVSRLEYQAGRLALARGDKGSAREHFGIARDKLLHVELPRWDRLPEKLDRAARSVAL